MSVKEKINPERVPQHIAIIMDGNGRWAQQRGQLRVFGHEQGVKAVREATEGAAEIGVKYLTLFAFSTENWNRPAFEVEALMRLLVETIDKETKTLMDNDIRLQTIGDTASLGGDCRSQLARAMKVTEGNQRMVLTLALNYSARWEIAEAARKIALLASQGQLHPEDVDQSYVDNCMTTAGMPDPELLIRTSGEFRLSNFLLWQSAYTELCFLPKLWPDFTREDLYRAILDFQCRERRFGRISEQLSNGIR
ncbi:MAG TPA: isoprenyl transferase [Bacteroidales bacterium]|nr:isoprenyl transferase [Lentimicrobiaceae bacterium]HOI00440.1 isoprenyl transferase [Bacteroidales bacterium]